jgi:hypothetical protein
MGLDPSFPHLISIAPFISVQTEDENISPPTITIYDHMDNVLPACGQQLAPSLKTIFSFSQASAERIMARTPRTARSDPSRVRNLPIMHDAVMITLLITVIIPAADSNMMTVNSRFGSVSNHISKVVFNLKPFIIVKNLDYSSLEADNARLSKEEEEYKMRIWSENLHYYPNNNDNFDRMARTKQQSYTALADSSGTFVKDSRRSITQFVHNLHSKTPMAIEMSPTYPNSTRKKRFIAAPAIAAVMGLIKLVGPVVCATVLEQTTKSVASKGFKSAAASLANKHNYVQAPDYRLQNASFPGVSPTFRKAGSNTYAKDIGQSAETGGNTKFIDQLTYYQLELSNLNVNRQIMTLRNERFMQGILDVQAGTVPISFLPPQELHNIITSITGMVRKDNLQLQHIADPSSPHNFYQFITPFLLIDNQYRMLLVMILPMIPETQALNLYHMSTLPFMTQEGIPLELVLPYEFYATDISGTRHSLMSRAEFDTCTRQDDIALCRLSRPLITERAQCYNALHFGGSTDEAIFQACKFKKADGNTHKFLYLSPNRFAYFLPRNSSLFLHCPDRRQATVSHLPRSGTFSYPARCRATIDNHEFFDTSVEFVSDKHDIPPAVVSFLQVARSAWPAISYSLSDSSDLLSAAKDSNCSEPLVSLTTRARFYAAFKDLLSLGQQQTDSSHLYTQIFYVVTAIVITIITQAISLFCYCCRHKIPNKLHMRMPKFTPKKDKLLEDPIYVDIRQIIAKKGQKASCASFPAPAAAALPQQPVYVPVAPTGSDFELIEHTAALEEFDMTRTYHKGFQ